MVDGADLLAAPAEAALTERLAAVEKATRHQFVVVTVKGLNGHDIADYGRALGNHWGIGRSQANDGVLLVVAPVERKVRIEVGKGLTNILTDGEAAEILRRDVLPRFGTGEMAAGILAGSEAIIGEITS